MKPFKLVALRPIAGLLVTGAMIFKNHSSVFPDIPTSGMLSFRKARENFKQYGGLSEYLRMRSLFLLYIIPGACINCGANFPI